jgi:hypothetical protein
MILPTKGVDASRALLAIGADVLELLEEPKTVSRAWEEIRILRESKNYNTLLSFDWFILCLDFLFTVGTLRYDRGRLVRVATNHS